MKNSGHRLTLSSSEVIEWTTKCLFNLPVGLTQPVNDQSINDSINQSNYSYMWSHLFCTIAGLALTFSGSLIPLYQICTTAFLLFVQRVRILIFQNKVCYLFILQAGAFSQSGMAHRLAGSLGQLLLLLAW